jgi:hypothetical protein
VWFCSAASLQSLSCPALGPALVSEVGD